MYYGEIKKFDISNGEGVRVSIFVSGCRVHCPGCFNKCTWDFQYGKLFTEETENEITEALSKEFISGLTVLGGEPFEPEKQEVLAPILSKVKKNVSQENNLVLHRLRLRQGHSSFRRKKTLRLYRAIFKLH